MKQLLRGFAGILILLTGALIFAPTSASAAEGFNVITSPLPIKISTVPGKTVSAELRIKNQGTQAEGINVGLMKFKANGETGQADLLDITKLDTFASWVHFEPQQFLAQPGVWNSVKMTIDVPADGQLGYYLAVTFSPANVQGVPKKTILKGSAATLVLLNVKSANEKRALSIVDFTADHSLYEYLPANFTIKVKNSGNIYLAPTGNIFITKNGKPVETIDFNSVGGSVLPGSTRKFLLSWEDGFPVFKPRLVDGKPATSKTGPGKQDLKYNFANANKFRFGKYTAKLLMSYDDGKQDVPVESTLTFWVIPYKIMLGGLFIVSLLGFGLFFIIRAAVRRTRTGSGKIRGRRN